jgi:hypothetical protein
MPWDLVLDLRSQIVYALVSFRREITSHIKRLYILILHNRELASPISYTQSYLRSLLPRLFSPKDQPCRGFA